MATRRGTDDEQGDDRIRLDKWLWAARFYKTRSLAAEAIAGGKVALNGERPKRAKPIHPGDVVRVRHGPFEHEIVVRELSGRRGSATVAATLYEETPQSRAKREQLALAMKSVTHDFAHEKGKPSKRERRQIHRFKDRAE